MEEDSDATECDELEVLAEDRMDLAAPTQVEDVTATRAPVAITQSEFFSSSPSVDALKQVALAAEAAASDAEARLAEKAEIAAMAKEKLFQAQLLAKAAGDELATMKDAASRGRKALEEAQRVADEAQEAALQAAALLADVERQSTPAGDDEEVAPKKVKRARVSKATSTLKVWQDLISNGEFQRVKVIVGESKFPLKDIQEAELKSWLAGCWDTDWLVIRQGVPFCFVSQSGEKMKLQVEAADAVDAPTAHPPTLHGGCSSVDAAETHHGHAENASSARATAKGHVKMLGKQRSLRWRQRRNYQCSRRKWRSRRRRRPLWPNICV